jgi:GMP synthase (glutamine-hydrolysing)
MVPLAMAHGQELVVMRPVHSTRAMVAQAAELPSALLRELAETIGALPGVGAVALDLTSKPPGTIEWE